MSAAENAPAFTLYEPRDIELAPGSTTFVLVPGAGHGAWCYDYIKKIIEDAGQTVHAVCLPGLGERAAELTAETGHEEHVGAVVDYIVEHDLTDVILVGHSYGGMVITATADRIPERIRRIVYLDAVHPSDGQNMPEAQPLMAYTPCVATPYDNNGVMCNMFDVEEVIHFCGLETEELISFARPRLTPHPWKSFTDHLHLTNPDALAAIPKSDIYTAMTIGGLLATGFATEDEAKAALVITSGHDLMLIEPELTANMLLYIATL